MTEKTIPESPSLKKEIKTRQFFSLSFGAIIGVGWIMVLGDWLEIAGPLGAMTGFLGGMIVMMVVGICYAELASLLPVTGGEVAYAYEIFGIKPSYAIGWLLCLAYIAVTSFEAISIGWILGILFPGTRGGVLYTMAGENVYLGSLLLGIGGMALLIYLNYRGIKSAAIFQEIFTYGLLALSLLFIGAGIFWGRFDNLTPLFSKTGTAPVIGGILAIFITAPNWYAGFNVIPQTMEEKAPGASLRLVVQMILLSIFIAGLFYVGLIFSASMATPWKGLLPLELPAAGAFEAALQSPLLAKVVLLAGLCGMITTWNTVIICSSRIIFTLGRAHIIPPVYGRIHPRFGSPSFTILFVGVVGTLGSFLGRSALLPIINVSSTCLALAFFFTCLGVIKLRKRLPHQNRPFRVPGGKTTAGIGVGICLFIFFYSIYQPFKDSGGAFPMEWGILIFWSSLGIVFWMTVKKIRSDVSEAERRRLILTGAVQVEKSDKNIADQP